LVLSPLWIGASVAILIITVLIVFAVIADK